MKRRLSRIISRLREGIGESDPRKWRDQYPEHQIGRGTYGNPQIVSWGDGTTLTIGAFCSFAAGVKIILGGGHRTDWVTTYPFPVFWSKARAITGQHVSKGPVVIGNDVWVGTDAIILSGVTIHDGAVIGARAVVAKDVPPYGVVVGNPARLVRTRFEEDVILRLMKIQWWNWDDSRIEELMPLMLQTDIHAFLNAAEKRL